MNMRKSVKLLVSQVLSQGEVLKSSDNYYLYGLRIKNNEQLLLVIVEKRNIQSLENSIALYSINDEKYSYGLMFKMNFEKAYIHNIGYSLEKSIEELRELEDYILLLSDSIRKGHINK
jgi:hypothetical protein